MYNEEVEETFTGRSMVKNSPLESELVEQSMAISNLFDVVERLRERLSPILSPVDRSEKGLRPELPPNPTRIVGRISENNFKLRELDGEVGRIISSLDL